MRKKSVPKRAAQKKKPIRHKPKPRIKKIASRSTSAPRILITSAIPYVNNVPHLGNIIGCVLSADVFARYCRRSGKETLYICGTDEHGTATEFKAQEEGLTPKEICDKYYAIHKQIYEWFGCSFDIFGRTSVQSHYDTTQELFRVLDKNGYIVEDTLQQTFCRRCDKFLADRFITGECPHCGHAEARGDQCDKCGKLLDPTELKNPKCRVCGSLPEIRESTHLFLDLSKIGPKLQRWIKATQDNGFWTENAKQITAAWFAEGLKMRCITRDLKWGVPVPKKGFENKVFYVWFDAPIGYISMTKQLTAQWKEWWQSPKQIKLYQFMAKDNIPFHTILFPATLLGSGQQWTMLHHIDAVEYLNYENGKFSKSLQQGVFGDDAMRSGIKADVWRYHLLVNRPETADSQFSWQDFQEKNNNELLANLGNFVNRTLTFLERNFRSTVPRAEMTSADVAEISAWNAQIVHITSLLEMVKEREALKAIMRLSQMGNSYFQQQEPWKKIEANPARAATTVALCANLAANLAQLIEPFLPFTAAQIADQLRQPIVDWPKQFTLFLPEGHRIGTPVPLFRKIEGAEILTLRRKFSGHGVPAEEASGEIVEQTQQSTHQHEHRKHAESEGGGITTFSDVDLRVGEIRSVEPHPNADKLYILQIDFGTEQRQLVAGLRAHYAPQELVAKRIVIVANLKPAVLRGTESKGMLLAAEQDGKVRVLEAKHSNPGDSVYATDVQKKPKEQITIEGFLSLGLQLRGSIPQWQGKALRTKHGILTVAELSEGKIR